MRGSENFFFGIDFRARPQITLGRFESTSRSIHRAEELSHLLRALRFCDLDQKLGMPLHIVITWAACRGGPRHFQGFVVSAKFDREVGLHPTWLAQAVGLPAVAC